MDYASGMTLPGSSKLDVTLENENKYINCWLAKIADFLTSW